MGYRTTRRQLKTLATKKPQPEPATLVISAWLNRCYAGQWTPLEAAEAIVASLNRAGYKIARKRS